MSFHIVKTEKGFKGNSHEDCSGQQAVFSERKSQRFFPKKSHAIVVTMVKCGRMMMVVKEMVMGRNTFFEAKLAEKGSRLLRHHQERRGRYEESLSFQMEWAGRE